MLKIQKLSINDGIEIYNMLKNIELNENEFTNPVKEMTFEQYKEWLILMDKWSKGQELKQGYVPQTIYWLYDDDVPVGIGKIRHALTESSRKFGGNIGYAISKEYRGKGFATVFLKMLLKEMNELNVHEKILTVEKENYPSRKVIEKNGGKVIEENEDRWIFEID